MPLLIPLGLRRLLLGALLAWGLLVGLARLGLPLLAERWQPELLQALSHALHPGLGLQSLSIQRISARWQGLGPQLRLHRLRLSGQQGQALDLAEVRLELALWDSLWQLRPVLGRVSLIGAKLRLRQLADGSVQWINGSASPGRSGFSPTVVPQGDWPHRTSELANPQSRIPSLLPRQLDLIDSQIQLQLAQGDAPLQLEQLNLRLDLQQQGFSLQGRLQIGTRQAERSQNEPSQQANHIRLGARIQGPLPRPELWSGQLYVQLQQLALDASLARLVPADWRQLQGQLGLRLWANLSQGQLQDLQGDVRLAGLRLLRQLRQRLSGYDLDLLQGRFHWRRQGEDWGLALDDLQLARQQTQWPKTAIQLQGRGTQQIQAAIEFLRLEDILALVMLLPENRAETLLTGLQRVQPLGDLRQLRFQRDGPRWRLTGSAERIRTLAWGYVPAINSLSATFRADQDGGIAQLDNRDVQLAFANDLFSQPMRLARLLGEVHWQRHPQGWQLGSQDLRLNTPDFKTGTRFSLSIPDQGQAHLDLHSRLEQGDVAYVHQYLPVGIMNPKVVRWLDRALVAGRIHSGEAVFLGPLRDFPFDQRRSGHFDARLDTQAVTLDYQTGWPRLERARIGLRFANNSFSAQLQEAEISASRVLQAQVRIDRLFPVTALELKGEVQGPLSDELRVLRETPLARRFGGLTEGVSAEGDVRLAIGLRVPLRKEDPDEIQVQGRLHFLDNSLELARWDLRLARLRGELEFDDQGVRAEGLQAETLGSAIRLQIKPARQGPRRTEILALGRFDPAQLSQQRLGQALPFASGHSDWHLLLQVPHPAEGQDKPAAVSLQLSSDLQGVKLDLPAPLGKTAKQKMPLELHLELAQTPLPARLRWGDRLQAQLLLADGQLHSGSIQLGGAAAKPPAAKGLMVQGQLPRLQLDPWIELLNKGPASDLRLPLPQVNLRLGQLELFGFRLNELSIQGGAQAQGWAAQLNSPQLQGQLRLPADLKAGPIELRLKQLAFNLSADDQPYQPKPPSRLDPARLPGLRLSSEQLLLNGHNLGRLELHSQHLVDGLDFSQLKIESDWFKLNLRGQWRQKAKQVPQCSAMFKLEASDMGRLQRVLDDVADLHRAPGRIAGNLSWSGSPLDIANRELDGELELDLDKGSIIELEPGAGRVFGLLNLGALQRRLSLDFSDLLGKGFGFDRISGRFVLHDGVADTNNLSIEAPTGVINLYGRTHLQSKELDQMIEVIPDITGTLATAGTLVGGPVVGAALFLANQVIGKELNKISRVRYLLNGPWDNPQIRRYGQDETDAKGPDQDHKAEDPFGVQ
ncbi:MAG: TIGR02099 family protein [Gammaproteobacteria bacterium SHHR-1]